MSLDIPVAFIVFNRPDTTARVLDAIRQQRPQRLLVVADGPRPGRSSEAERCKAVRRLIDDGVDWPCDVERCWSDANLGCRRRLSTGLSWVFSRTDRAIILEDDCLPHPTFFPYCIELLDRYADDQRISTIGGCSFLDERTPTEASYRFTRYPHIWGWASWARAWRSYDVDVAAWPGLRSNGWLDGECTSGTEADFWRAAFDGVRSGRIDTWDFQWVFASWAQRMASIAPAVNLVSNIGFGAGATHTASDSPLAALPTQALELPLRHPPTMHIDHRSDRCVAQQQFRRSLRRRWFDHLMKRA
jgi:hypothetical protein